MKPENLPEKIDEKIVENLIYEIRGMQVMLDSDVAFFFNVSVRRLNEQMKRNINRFPQDFCFKLNSKEFKNLRSQNAIFKDSTNGRKYAPYVYTEHGIIALAGVIKSDLAAKASVEIARKFVEMRKTLIENSNLILMATETKRELLEFENETNKRFDEIYRWKESKDIPKNVVIFEGNLYDAFEFVTRIIKSAKESIVLVDPYVDSTAFIYLNHKLMGVAVTIYKGIHSRLKDEEISIFESQNGNLTSKTKTPLHDRYIIIDQKDCYMLGSSLNSIGKSFLGIAKFELDGPKKCIIEQYPL